ncbi:MAG: hypothetical protein Q4B90_06335 [Eubacteriales bacterium]|nr:hypothetical protein [Eubacteriales bacterium]
MKKRFLSLSAILGTSFLLLTGFDSAVTPESIMQDSMAAMQNVSSFDINAGFDMVLNIEMITGSGEDAVPTSIGTGIGGNFGMKISEDRGMAMNIAMDVAAMGMTESVNMDMYAVPNAEAYDLYSYDSESGMWMYEQALASEVQQTINEIMNTFTAVQGAGMSEEQLSGLDFVLSDELVTVNGVSCYELKTTVDSSDVAGNEDQIMDLFGQSGMMTGDQEMYDSMMNGLHADLTYYVDADTKMPVQITMDMSQTDMSAYANMMKDSLEQEMNDASEAEPVETSVNVSLDPCMFTINLSFNNTPSITVPEEAIQGVQAGESEVSSLN